MILHFYRTPALSEAAKNALLKANPGIKDIESEYCFNIQSEEPLSDGELAALRWLLSETFEPEGLTVSSALSGDVIEVGPRLNFETAFSTNAVSVCRAAGLDKITRVERSRRFQFLGLSSFQSRLPALEASLYDRMTECVYPEPLTSFETGLVPEAVLIIPVLEEGLLAIERINRSLGLGLDDWDIDYYYDLFKNLMRRNPTNVECFDLGQSNSEHSRHWFFRGKLIIDGKEAPLTLMDLIKAPYKQNPRNSVIAFRDNSSAIKGFETATIIPEKGGHTPSKFIEKRLPYDVIFTAETHNFPSGVAPFPGAETGTGGRIRDTHAVGRGGLVVAGTAAYCVGNLLIPGYPLPWEDASFSYPSNLASPLQIEIEASNGASDYGNCFGEPVIQGFTRSFGLKLPDGRREWIKPIMFTGGVGQMDARHTEKLPPEKGMLVIKIGGPAYRIGMGGGAASSMLQGENIEELDFNAVQRGDAEMEQKLNRVIRASVEMGADNPIISIHDQGAGGNCNVLKELIYPEGAKIELRAIPIGDKTLSVLEIWGAEYQEDDALLIRPEQRELFETLCRREKVPVAIIGEITGDGRIVLYDSMSSEKGSVTPPVAGSPVDLDLRQVLGEMPQKTFKIERKGSLPTRLVLPEGLTVRAALERVLRLLSVGSKRFLTSKVDRCVTGLIARQQCCGPLGLTVSDTAVIAQSHFAKTGAAIAIGEQPIKGLINPAAMARMSVAEALTNIVWCKVTSIEDVRCSANWMWAAKLAGEGAQLYDAAVAMSDYMCKLGIAVDGGKDSLSMATLDRNTGEVVKSPGALVISAYVTCPDVTKVITPDIKEPDRGKLLYIDLGGGNCRLGGSALAQVYGQIGDESPDIEDAALLKNAFNAVQRLIDRDLILSGHDISDGGLITTLLEMAFSGNCGIDVRLEGKDPIAVLFAEEAGLVIEYAADKEDALFGVLKEFSVPCEVIGRAASEKKISVSVGGQVVLDEDMRMLRALWEETSFELEKLQTNPECAEEEKKNVFDRTGPKYRLSFTPEVATGHSAITPGAVPPAVAIVREEGSNGDREMTSAFYQAGFEPWDVTMTDIIEGRAVLDGFRGVAFVGGFSYADVLDSAKGWAGVVRFNDRVRHQFEKFYARPDTFSLGVCNGCQLMALMGWVPWAGVETIRQPRFIRNKSGRFESRFPTVKILQSPSIMLKGMEGSSLGIWVAHGEGRAYFPDKDVFEEVKAKGLAPVRFVDDRGEITESYPFNPNGSPEGIAALCSPDGRHLAIMPHPERTFLKWQWAWMPEAWKKELKASPWLRMFQNARKWCGA